jgi:carboxyl-terminal processing protease
LRRGERLETFSALPATPRYTGRLRILVDARTGSAAELLASALQDAGRAEICGEATAGSTRSRRTTLLPGHVVLHYGSSAVFCRVDGSAVEGVGVEPDLPISLTMDALALGSYGDPLRDPAIRRACRLD